MRKVMFALAIVAGAFMTAGPVSAQCRYIMNDVGRFHGYLSGPCNGAAVGYAGAYPSHPNTGAMAHPTVVAPKVVPQANSRGDGCVGRCPAKTDDGESAVRRRNDIRDVVRAIAVAVLSSEHRLHGARDIRPAASGDVAARRKLGRYLAQ